MDIVIPTIRDLSFLEKWKGIFDKHHLIIVQDGDTARKISVPIGFDYELHNWDDIKKELGENSWIIPRKDGGCRCFGFLKAKSKYVFCIDDDCFPAFNDSEIIDPVLQHEENLKSFSHPDYFNTLYDGEFVRGYPFERRIGKPTAISHGLWLNVPDFDAPTQMVKPYWRNTKIVDAVVSIPRGVLYPMSAMNLAFNRELIGITMYHGLMGEKWPLSKYDDLFAGWCSKVICDHLGYGVKNGKPYIYHDRASNWRDNLKREYQGLIWQEDIINFFESVRFSLDCKDVETCYLDLADQVERELSKLDGYFIKLASAMRVWANIWGKNSQAINSSDIMI